MPGVTKLSKVQLGQESTAGTAVAATQIWRGSGRADDQREVVFVDENIGILPQVNRTYIPKLAAGVEFAETPATFEQLSYIFSGGVEDVTTGVQDGAGSDYIYQHDAATTAQVTPQTFTIETGDDQQAEETEYCFVNDFTLSGAAGESVMLAANWIGRQVTNTTFTGAISVPSVEEVLFQKGTLYSDASGGTIGSTQISNSLLSFNLSYTSGFMPVWTADGDLFFSFIKQTRPELTMEMTFEHDSSMVAYMADFRAETTRLIQLNFTGSAVGTPGTTYSNKTFIINFAGQIESVSTLDDQDGNAIRSVTWRGVYSSTDSLFAQFIVVNELTSLS